MAGLAAGASILPTACRAMQSPSETADATVPQLATPTPAAAPNTQSAAQNVSRVVLVRSEDRVSGFTIKLR